MVINIAGPKSEYSGCCGTPSAFFHLFREGGVNGVTNMKPLAMSALAAAGLLGVATTAAIAMPIASSATFDVTSIKPENVKLVCDQFGRCWRSGPRRIVRRYYQEPAYYGPAYGHYGPGYSYGPAYGFYGPGYGYGPSIGLGFGFGRHWW